MNKVHPLTLVMTLAVTILVSTVSHAAVIRYEFIGHTFEDGATASGYFDWDTMAPQTAPEYEGGAIDYEISVVGGSFTDHTYTQAADGPMDSGGTTSGIRILTVGDISTPPQ